MADIIIPMKEIAFIFGFKQLDMFILALLRNYTLPNRACQISGKPLMRRP